MHNHVRRYTRFFTENRVYIALGNDFSKVGKVVDISIAGLAFEYYSEVEDSLRGTSNATIFVTQDDFQLIDLACEVVYDTSISILNHKSDLALKKKRCGLRFMTLTEAERNFLERLIQVYVPQ